MANKSAPSLREVQSAIASELKNLDNNKPLKKLEFIEENGFSANFRLNIYKHGANAKYIQQILNSFSRTFSFFSKKRVLEIATEFAKKHPSNQFSSSDSLVYFPAFLADYIGLKKYPFLAELAELEWKMVLAWYMPTSKEASADGKMTLNGSVTFFSSEWKLLYRGHAIHRLTAASARKRRQMLAIWYEDQSLVCKPVSDAESQILGSHFPAQVEFNTQRPGLRNGRNFDRLSEKSAIKSLKKKKILL